MMWAEQEKQREGSKKEQMDVGKGRWKKRMKFPWLESKLTSCFHNNYFKVVQVSFSGERKKKEMKMLFQLCLKSEEMMIDTHGRQEGSCSLPNFSLSLSLSLLERDKKLVPTSQDEGWHNKERGWGRGKEEQTTSSRFSSSSSQAETETVESISFHFFSFLLLVCIIDPTPAWNKPGCPVVHSRTSWYFGLIVTAWRDWNKDLR